MFLRLGQLEPREVLLAFMLWCIWLFRLIESHLDAPLMPPLLQHEVLNFCCWPLFLIFPYRQHTAQMGSKQNTLKTLCQEHLWSMWHDEASENPTAGIWTIPSQFFSFQKGFRGKTWVNVNRVIFNKNEHWKGWGGTREWRSTKPECLQRAHRHTC